MKGCILLFPKKGNLRITKNYRGTTIAALAAKVYNALPFNHILHEAEKTSTKNQNTFQRNRSTLSQTLTIHRNIEEVCAKNPEATLVYRFFLSM